MTQVYCTAPWDHLHVTGTGGIGVCCIANMSVAADTVEEGRNSPEMKELRKLFAAGEAHPVLCKACIAPNSPHVYRDHHLLNAGDRIPDMLAATAEDGSTTYAPHTFDLRGNTCNLACRTCGGQSSSTIAAEEKRTINFIRKMDPLANKSDYVSDAFLIDSKEFYWAGGEPFMMPIHWQVMDKLVELNRTDVTLRYNTNFTFPTERGLDRAIKLLGHFSNVRMNISIDGTDEIGEYIRVGWKQAQMVSAIHRFQRDLPHIPLAFDATITSIGLLTMPDMIHLALELGVGYKAKIVNTHRNNEYLSINVLAPWVVDGMCDQMMEAASCTILEAEVSRIVSTIKARHAPISLTSTHLMYIEQMEEVRGGTGFFMNMVGEFLNG